MIFHGNKTVTTAGTPVPLAGVYTPFTFLTIYPKKTNTGEVRIGGGLLTNATGAITYPPTSIAAGLGMPLVVGDAGVAFPTGAAGNSLDQVYVDADVSGEGVQFIYGAQ